MENFYKLKSLQEKFKDVVIAHCMTQKERDQCKALVAEAKLKTEQEAGEWIYCVGPAWVDENRPVQENCRRLTWIISKLFTLMLMGYRTN